MAKAGRPRRTDAAARTFFGFALKNARERLGLSQTHVASRLGVAQSTLAEYETGRTTPSQDKIDALALILETNSAALNNVQAQLLKPEVSGNRVVKQSEYIDNELYDKEFIRLYVLLEDAIRKTSKRASPEERATVLRTLWRRARTNYNMLPIDVAVETALLLFWREPAYVPISAERSNEVIAALSEALLEMTLPVHSDAKTGDDPPIDSEST